MADPRDDEAVAKQTRDLIRILPYDCVIAQEELKLALELCFIAGPRLGGVLISGSRGAGKSTVVRAFARMAFDDLPVTLPLNATEDRVIGHWDVRKLMEEQKPDWRKGVLARADRNGLLYIDEVNLLDDHIVNLILDAASTGVLVTERDGGSATEQTDFALVGTMNPEEGALRPQLLDRFGLVVGVGNVAATEERIKIVQAVLAFDEARKLGRQTDYFERNRRADEQRRARLEGARKKLDQVGLPSAIIAACVRIATRFKVEGHRADYVLALAARAYAARADRSEVSLDDLRVVAPLAVRHRRPGALEGDPARWSENDNTTLEEALSR